MTQKQKGAVKEEIILKGLQADKFINNFII